MSRAVVGPVQLEARLVVLPPPPQAPTGHGFRAKPARKWSALILGYQSVSSPIVEAPGMAAAVLRLVEHGLLDDAFSLQLSPIDGRQFVDNVEAR